MICNKWCVCVCVCVCVCAWTVQGINPSKMKIIIYQNKQWNYIFDGKRVGKILKFSGIVFMKL